MSSAPDLDDPTLPAALAQVRELQRTVVVLREELEAAQLERARQVQDATATVHADLQHARATIQALRDALELAQVEHDAALTQMAAAHRAELVHLHDTVRALRDELEARHG